MWRGGLGECCCVGLNLSRGNRRDEGLEMHLRNQVLVLPGLDWVMLWMGRE